MAKRVADGVAPIEATPPTESGPPRPAITDPEWSDYTKTFFLPDELSPDSSPTTDGLRRVTELLLGPIIRIDTQVFGTPSAQNDHRATVGVVVHIRQGDNDIRIYGDAADVYPGNTDPEYARHATASAQTKAEARCYRKALRLRRVIAAEEKTTVPVAEAGLGNFNIAPFQIRGVEKTCRDLDIDVMKLVNSGKKHYDKIEDMSKDTAIAVLGLLNDYFRGKTAIPDQIRGFNEGWRSA